MPPQQQAVVEKAQEVLTATPEEPEVGTQRGITALIEVFGKTQPVGVEAVKNVQGVVKVAAKEVRAQARVGRLGAEGVVRGVAYQVGVEQFVTRVVKEMPSEIRRALGVDTQTGAQVALERLTGGLAVLAGLGAGRAQESILAAVQAQLSAEEKRALTEAVKDPAMVQTLGQVYEQKRLAVQEAVQKLDQTVLEAVRGAAVIQGPEQLGREAKLPTLVVLTDYTQVGQHEENFRALAPAAETEENAKESSGPWVVVMYDITRATDGQVVEQVEQQFQKWGMSKGQVKALMNRVRMEPRVGRSVREFTQPVARYFQGLEQTRIFVASDTADPVGWMTAMGVDESEESFTLVLPERTRVEVQLGVWKKDRFILLHEALQALQAIYQSA
ncbi:MAG: hypothetical protein HYZ73_08905 [Elusimicrobia bacterium]|nr:hypothetical protein [Elusimicrobiota bacterium]